MRIVCFTEKEIDIERWQFCPHSLWFRSKRGKKNYIIYFVLSIRFLHWKL